MYDSAAFNFFFFALIIFFVDKFRFIFIAQRNYRCQGPPILDLSMLSEGTIF